MKVGLFGGAFDPIHKTHIEIATKAKQQLGLDEVWILIDKNPRRKETITPYQHRLAMARLAASGHKYMITDRLKQQKLGTTYGLEDTKKLVNKFKETHFTIILGLDAFMYFDKWDYPEGFCKLVNFAVFDRKNVDINILNKLSNKYKNLKYEIIDFEISSTSSRQIRHKVKNNYSVVNELDSKVIKYIKQEKLYVGVRE